MAPKQYSSATGWMPPPQQSIYSTAFSRACSSVSTVLELQYCENHFHISIMIAFLLPCSLFTTLNSPPTRISASSCCLYSSCFSFTFFSAFSASAFASSTTGNFKSTALSGSLFVAPVRGPVKNYHDGFHRHWLSWCWSCSWLGHKVQHLGA